MSTAFYEGHDIPTCPDGDKLRSDEEGLFCVVEGDSASATKVVRVAAQLINGSVVLKPVAKKKAGDKADGNG